MLAAPASDKTMSIEERYARYCLWRFRLLQLVGAKHYEMFRKLELS